MIQMVAGLILFLIYAFVKARRPDYHLTVQARNSYIPPSSRPVQRVYIPCVPPVKKQPDRPFKEQLEELQIRSQDSAGAAAKSRYAPKQQAATWFIGTWGINDPSPAEQMIIDELNKYKVKWYREVSFSDLLTPSGGYYRFDFYLPGHQVAIEYQGIGYHSSKDRIASDKVKARYCKDNNITLHLYDIDHYRNMDGTVAGLMKSLQVRLK